MKLDISNYTFQPRWSTFLDHEPFTKNKALVNPLLVEFSQQSDLKLFLCNLLYHSELVAVAVRESK